MRLTLPKIISRHSSLLFHTRTIFPLAHTCKNCHYWALYLIAMNVPQPCKICPLIQIIGHGHSSFISATLPWQYVRILPFLAFGILYAFMLVFPRRRRRHPHEPHAKAVASAVIIFLFGVGMTNHKIMRGQRDGEHNILTSTNHHACPRSVAHVIPHSPVAHPSPLVAMN